jgi:hypothetical protein
MAQTGMASGSPTNISNTIPCSAPHPKAIYGSYAKSYELVEAVAALNVNQSAQAAERPLRRTVGIDNLRGVDSGYESKSGSPESPNFIDGGAVAGKAPRWPIARRKKIKLKPFDKEIPRLTQNRFNDLRELYADSLTKLTRGPSSCRGILMTLKVLGESESTAAPWVFIQCDKTAARKVRRFFEQPSVESDFKPPEPNSYQPSFEIYVHEMPPLELWGNSPGYLTSEDDDNLLYDMLELYFEYGRPYGSLCGSKIVSWANGQRRIATIGGLVEVRKTDGSFHTLGMTAGHFLAHQNNALSLDLEEDFDEEDSFDNDQDFELDPDSLKYDAPAYSVDTTSRNHANVNAISDPIWTTNCQVFGASQNNIQDQPNLDWALFTIQSSHCMPNIISLDEISRISGANALKTDTDQAVILATAKSGIVEGMISSSWSYLMLAPGNCLVRTKALKLQNNRGQWLCIIAYKNPLT